MKFQNIRKYFGQEWFDKQTKIIQNKAQFYKEGIEEKFVISAIEFIFGEMDKLISKFEKLDGFDEWIKEAKTTKNLETCLFELMSMEIFIEKSDSI